MSQTTPRYRVDDLAARCGVSVDTVRYYQSKGLLAHPDRQGRIAWYDDTHLARLERIRDLKDQGFTLAMISRVLSGDLDPTDEALAAALSGPLGEAGSTDELLDLAQLAERSGVSLALLEAVEREGLLIPRVNADGAHRYTIDDAGVITSGLALLEAGVPLSELMALARRHTEAMEGVIEHAVDLFARYVRDPIRISANSDEEAGRRMVEALNAMLPATGTIVAHHFRRRLLAAARARMDGPAETAGE